MQEAERLAERHDAAFLPVLWEAAAPLTIAQLSERCENPWAPPHVGAWLQSAFSRGLIRARRSSDLPLELTLTPKGARAARRL